MDLEALEREMVRLNNHKVPDDNPSLSAVEQWGMRHDDGLRWRSEGQQLMRTVIDRYASTDDATRAQIRVLLARYNKLTWWSHPDNDPADPEFWRLELLSISACDRFSDPRDTIVMIDELTKAAIEKGVDLGPTLDEVAAISSDDARLFGSTRKAMLNARRRVPKR